MIYSTVNKRIFFVRGIGRVSSVAVLSRDKTDVSRSGGGVNVRGKKMANRCLERMTLKVGMLRGTVEFVV